MKIWSSESDWNLVLPPSRPCESQLNLISRIISEKCNKESKIAVLGSTPEFRDLVYELNIGNVYIFDKSIEFYQKMSEYRAFDNDEVFVYGDWLNTLNKYSDYFDIILSDLTSGNISYSSRKKFFWLIENALKLNGIFIDKYLSNENGLLSLTEIRNKYINKSINLQNINDFSCEAIFCSELQRQNGIIDTTQIYQQLKDEFGDNKRLLKFIELSHYITPENCVWYYGNQNVDYIKNLNLIIKLDLTETVYENKAWIFAWQKNI